jgi:hypothetical protein
MKDQFSKIYQFSVVLREVDPPVWRRIQVPGSYTFWDLHVAIQDAMGWRDYHLHEFEILNPATGDRDRIGIPSDEFSPDLEWLAGWEIPISAYFSPENPEALYTYDFGDGWEHSVTLEAILPREPGLDYPRCLAGERACPPEDCGGVYGYAEFLEAIQDPEHEEHQSMLEWVGDAFDPEYFRPEAVQFDDPDERWRIAFGGREAVISDAEQVLEADQGVARRFVNWMQQDAGDHVAQAEALPLRRDMVTLLVYVRDQRVTGTQSTGNFPLKVVRDVTAQFVHPPKLEETIGERTFRIRSEDDVWPLSFLHTLAYVGGLLEGGPARRWRLTSVGEKFLAANPLIQVWALLAVWWKQVNWLIAYPFEGMGEDLPPHFQQITLDHLLSLPVDTRIPFEPFADRLIGDTGLKWTSRDTTYHRMFLHGAIQRMVIHILAAFGIVEREYRDKPLGKGTIPELVAFQVTPFGKRLLESLK